MCIRKEDYIFGKNITIVFNVFRLCEIFWDETLSNFQFLFISIDKLVRICHIDKDSLISQEIYDNYEISDLKSSYFFWGV